MMEDGNKMGGGLRFKKMNEMKLHIISVTYGHKLELDVFCASLLLQTRKDWTCEIWHDGLWETDALKIAIRYAHMSDGRIMLKHTEKRNQKWGHVSRRIALDGLKGDNDDFVLNTNCDNYYTMNFVEDTLAEVKKRDDIGIVMVDCIHSHIRWGYHKSQLFEGGIDLGAAIVRFDIAKTVGFKHEHFSADGAYLTECGVEAHKRGLCAVHIPKALFVHN